MSAELAALVADPDRIEQVPPEALPGLLGEVAAVQARLWARLQAASVPARETLPAARNGGRDQLLTAGQAAERLGVGRRWMYRHAHRLPFTRRLSGGTLRFSERGLERWQETRR